jgi:hypothetical protein
MNVDWADETRIGGSIAMLFGNEKLFAAARAAKLGCLKLPPVLAELRDWITTEFGVSVVYVDYDLVELGPSEGRPRLTVILETDADFDRYKLNVVEIEPSFEEGVLSRFRELAAADPSVHDSTGVFLILDNFSEECLGRAANRFVREDARDVIREFASASIWKIDGYSRDLVVFFPKQADIARNAAQGVSVKISNHCLELVKKYDEFGFLTPASFRLRFDSRENVDKNYHGNMFYYWR